MSESYREQFAIKTLEADHAEAIQIDNLIDAHNVDGQSSGLSLEQAVEQNNQALIKPYSRIPGAEEIGYDTLKNAFRWWNYATAYLRDLEDRLEPGQVLPISRANYGETKNETGDRLIRGDFLATSMCDLLEKERRARGQRKNQEHSYEYFDLFRVQNFYASLALATTVEMLVGDSDREEGPYEQVVSANNRTATYAVQRLDEAKQTVYIVDKQLLDVDERSYDYTKRELQGMYSFTRPHNSVMVYPDRSEEIIAPDMLDMTNDLSAELDIRRVFKHVETALESRLAFF